MKKMTKGQQLLGEAFHELKHNPARIVKHTKRKFGKERARKQTIAIAYSKARRAGARI